jgi:hypothetical protein
MIKPFAIVLLAALAGCSAMPKEQYGSSPCSVSEVSYECQVDRYRANY